MAGNKGIGVNAPSAAASGIPFGHFFHSESAAATRTPAIRARRRATDRTSSTVPIGRVARQTASGCRKSFIFSVALHNHHLLCSATIAREDRLAVPQARYPVCYAGCGDPVEKQTMSVTLSGSGCPRDPPGIDVLTCSSHKAAWGSPCTGVEEADPIWVVIAFPRCPRVELVMHTKTTNNCC